MSDKDTGGFAFPVHGSMGEVAWEGMTLRDYFAAKVMPEVYASAIKTAAYTGGEIFLRENWRLDLALEAFKMADAMLEARK
jgi:hypothetical protein